MFDISPAKSDIRISGRKPMTLSWALNFLDRNVGEK
jgi:hypothetical protein